MTACPSSTILRSIVGVAVTTLVLSMSEPQPVFCQNIDSRQNKCAISESLKPIKTVAGNYSEEATKKNVEGGVVLCATVDGHGKVTDVSPLSGPPELLQLSMNAARQWQFEAPPKAPAFTQIEMRYSLTKPCPEGKRDGRRRHRHDNNPR